MNRYFLIKIFLAVAISTIFQDCSKNKELKVYDSNGSLRSEWIFDTDTLTGKKITYWDNGQVKEVHNFKNGKLDGEYRGYYKNGYIARKSQFYNNIVRGPAFKFFEDANGSVETETYFLDVMGKQYGYYSKVFDNTGEIITEKRATRLNFDCNHTQKSARLFFADDFSYDSVYVIVGDFAADFSLNKTASVDTIRTKHLPVSILLGSNLEGDSIVRGKCIFFTGTNEGDSTLVNVKIRWLEEKVPAMCEY